MSGASHSGLSNMPLQLLPMEEADLYAYQSIFAEAFSDGLMSLFYPNGYTEEAKQIGIDFQRKEWLSHPDKVKLMKVVDTDLPNEGTFGQIVGVSKWKFYPRDRTDGELQEEADEDSERPFPPGSNQELMKAFFGAIGKCKKEVLGAQAYAALSVLGTLSHHHRRGIGSMQLRWGLAKADEVSSVGIVGDDLPRESTCRYLRADRNVYYSLDCKRILKQLQKGSLCTNDLDLKASNCFHLMRKHGDWNVT